MVNCLKTCHLIILSHPLHPSPECTWPLSFVWISLIWSSYPIFFIRLQHVREFGVFFLKTSSDHSIPFSSSVSRMYVTSVNCLNTSHLIIPSHPPRPSPGCTWTSSIVWKPLIWSSHPILFIHLQAVRELGHLFEILSSNHSIPSSPVCTWNW
jgi:hypothetical protein